MKDDVRRGPKGKRWYNMDYIPDKMLFKAVVFAREMIRNGTAPGIAIHRAAKYYGYEAHDVAHYVGQTGGTQAGRQAT